MNTNLSPQGKGKFIEWVVGTQVMPGEVESGDTYVVKEYGGTALVAAIDGLGHGVEAALAAKIAAGALLQGEEESVISLLRRCHGASLNTRGVVMSLALFDAKDDTLTWAGVGNVEGLLLHSDPAAQPPVEYLLMRPGGIGFQMPELRATVMPVKKGDLLIFVTDGIRSDFTQVLAQRHLETPMQIAERIMAENRKGTDDALVLVVRYRGRGT